MTLSANLSLALVKPAQSYQGTSSQLGDEMCDLLYQGESVTQKRVSPDFCHHGQCGVLPS